MSWNDSDHQALRRWVNEKTSFRDPEDLIFRHKGGQVVFKNRSCLRAYNTIKAAYDTEMKQQRLANAKKIQENAKNAEPQKKDQIQRRPQRQIPTRAGV